MGHQVWLMAHYVNLHILFILFLVNLSYNLTLKKKKKKKKKKILHFYYFLLLFQTRTPEQQFLL